LDLIKTYPEVPEQFLSVFIGITFHNEEYLQLFQSLKYKEFTVIINDLLGSEE
jgi:hypothetical protein